MLKNGRVSILITAVVLLTLLAFSLSADEGAVDTKGKLEEPPVPSVETAKRAFKEMDTLLDIVIQWLLDIDEVSTKEEATQLKGYIVLLKKYKERVIKSMPNYLGVSFWAWHNTFNLLNRMLDHAATYYTDDLVGADAAELERGKWWLDRIKGGKKQIEGWLPD
jgi:hypothetical protein